MTPPHAAPAEAWPELPPLAAWQATHDTLHRWTQVVGKIRMACTPLVNHWWNVPLYVATRGLTTSPIPWGGGSFTIDLDFVDHALRITTSSGDGRAFALAPMSVAAFHRATMAALAELGIAVRIWPVPVEVPDPAVPFAEDEANASYDADAVTRFWQALVHADRVLAAFRAEFTGKASPVHFFWGGFDLAVTRFSGRAAPRHPGGAPNVGAWVMHEAYSHEVSSAGFWPGGALGEAAFYAYAYPAPAGFAEQPVAPAAAYYHAELGEFVLPYAAVRAAPDPDAALLAFLRTTYEAAAGPGGWDRAALERTTA